MNKTPPTKWIVFTVRILVPIVLLGVVFWHINWRILGQHLCNLHLGFLVAGILAGVIPQIFVGAYRWKYMLQTAYSRLLPFEYLLKHYWIGMFLGYFAPSSLGWDAYRVAVISQRHGGVGDNMAVVVGEKFVGVLVSISLILVIYPVLVPQLQSSKEVVTIVGYVYVGGICGIVVLTLAVIVGGRKFVRQPINVIDGILARATSWLARKVGISGIREVDAGNVSLVAMFKPFLNWKYLLVIVLLTLGIRAFACLATHCFFVSMDQNVSPIVILFAISLMRIIFMLPISIGSLGVREGSFVVLYGLFGVDNEVALAMSFVGLAALLLTVCLGGGILLLDSIDSGHRGQTTTPRSNT